MPEVAVAILARDPLRAKSRLAPDLLPPSRALLARAMFEDVLDAACGSGAGRVLVVSESAVLCALAEARGAAALMTPARGTNAAAEAARAALAAGDHGVLILHADLPCARPADLAALLRARGIVIVPDRRRAGTNALLLPAGSALRPRFGPGSFARHVAAARATGEPWRAAVVPRLALDIDTTADLRALRRAGLGVGVATRAALSAIAAG